MKHAQSRSKHALFNFRHLCTDSFSLLGKGMATPSSYKSVPIWAALKSPTNELPEQVSPTSSHTSSSSYHLKLLFLDTLASPRIKRQQLDKLLSTPHLLLTTFHCCHGRLHHHVVFAMRLCALWPRTRLDSLRLLQQPRAYAW